jgi:AraC-like DNA-binding protein
MLAQVLEAHARIKLQRPTGGGTLGFELQRAILAALPEGARMADVARALHLSPRTLQRRLAQAGSSYREALDGVREEVACRHLEDPSLSLAEVGLLLGFGEASSFHRAFERWTGRSPGRWRAAHPPGARRSEPPDGQA